jgi:hypothetical protein
MHDPNTEIFINACVTLVFLRFLRLRGESTMLVPTVIGALSAIAALFKTVAIAIAVVMGLMYLVLPPPGCQRSRAATQVAVMAVTGAICLAATLGYFAATGRFQAFWEVLVVAGQTTPRTLGRVRWQGSRGPRLLAIGSCWVWRLRWSHGSCWLRWYGLIETTAGLGCCSGGMRSRR